MINHIAIVFTFLLFSTPLLTHGEQVQSPSGPADDVRSRVAAVDPSNGTTIVPDVSIYGIPFGASEEQVIARFGKPNGYIQLLNKKSAMLYGK